MTGITKNLLAVVTGMVALSSLVAAAPPASGRGAVFVMTNAADRNEVFSYDRDAYGKLYEHDRYVTGGRGSGGKTDPLESQGSLTLSKDRGLLFAVNAG